MATGFLSDRAGKMGLPGTGETIDDQVRPAGDKAARTKPKDRVPVQAASFVIYGVDIGVWISQLCAAHQPFGAVVILCRIAFVDQQVQTVIKAHAKVGIPVRLLVVECFDHRFELHFAEFASGFITDHRDHLLRSSCPHGQRRPDRCFLNPVPPDGPGCPSADGA